MHIESQLPLISCICITENRPEMLFKSILSFAQQTYENKELVISYPKTDEKTRLLVNYFLENKGISLISLERKENESIGKARNKAIANSNGEYICIWDDDDIFHEVRIAEQYNALLTNNDQFQASVISQIFLYHIFNLTAYVSFPSYWACTLLCKREYILNNLCSDTDQFECKPILNYLNSTNQLISINSSPFLYTYVFHGGNLMQYSSFLYLVNQSFPISIEITTNIREYLEFKAEIPL